MTQKWFYTKDGKTKVGPLSPQELRALAECGQLSSSDMVMKEGTGKWVPAQAVKGLFRVPDRPPQPVLGIVVASASAATRRTPLKFWAIGASALLLGLAFGVFYWRPDTAGRHASANAKGPTNGAGKEQATQAPDPKIKEDTSGDPAVEEKNPAGKGKPGGGDQAKGLSKAEAKAAEPDPKTPEQAKAAPPGKSGKSQGGTPGGKLPLNEGKPTAPLVVPPAQGKEVSKPETAGKKVSPKNPPVNLPVTTADTDVVKALPVEIRVVWEDAGFSTGSFQMVEQTAFGFGTGARPPFRARDPFTVWRGGKTVKGSGGFRAFPPGFFRHLKTEETETLAKLPAPGSPFGIRLWGAGVTASVVKHLTRFRALKALDLARTDLTDADLAALAGLKLQCLAVPLKAQTQLGLKHRLAALELCPTELDLSKPLPEPPPFLRARSKGEKRWRLPASGSKLWPENHWHTTDAGLKVIAGLRELEWLNLDGTEVTDAGLKHLAPLKKLTTLFVAHTGVEGKGLAQLQALEWLSLGHTPLADSGLKVVGTLKDLRELNLAETHVTSAGLEKLARLQNLRTLDLSGTQVNNSGLAKLASLKQLRTLIVSRTPTTPAGRELLKRALPQLKIENNSR